MPRPKLEDQLRDAIRERHYSSRTEQADVIWCRQFIRFHRLRHPREMGEAGVTAFLKHLTVEREALRDPKAHARSQWEADRRLKVAGVAMPQAFAVKSPKAGKRGEWCWLFPADHASTDPRSGTIRR